MDLKKQLIGPRFPAALYDLALLSEVVVHTNNIERFPDGISRLQALEKLDIAQNVLTFDGSYDILHGPRYAQLTPTASWSGFSEDFGNIPNLRHLDVRN